MDNEYKALQINLLQLPTLNQELRKCFLKDYPGKTWFWHRLVWKLPAPIFNGLEFLAILFIAFFNSPTNSYETLCRKWAVFTANQKNDISNAMTVNVGSCFSKKEVKKLAQSMRSYYSSCLWKKGDILLVDNRKVMHAGMPGKGKRVVRALIGNPIEMTYLLNKQGCIQANERLSETLGACMRANVDAG